MESVLKETRERMQKSLDAFEANIATIRTGPGQPGDPQPDHGQLLRHQYPSEPVGLYLEP